MILKETGKSPWPELSGRTPGNSGYNATAAIRVHEFHYARLQSLEGDHVYTQRVLRGAGIDGVHDGLLINKLVAGFAHHRNTEANRWVERFVAFVREHSG